jgi:hypothetical protein
MKAKAAAANDGEGEASAAEESAKAGPDMFEAAGVAAE